jgi:hypothetical protein
MPSAARGDGAAIQLPRIAPGSPIRLPRRRRPGQPPRARRRRLRRTLGAIAVKHLLVATIALVRAAPDHRWLDRLVRSRWWIPVLGVMLTAIVAMQVEVLKYGAGTGRAINLATRLESRNQLLSASVASLDSPQRIEQAAAQMGMVMAGPTRVQFVHGSAPGSVHDAISHIESPSSESFMTALATAGGTGTASANGGSTATAVSLAAAATAAVNAGAAATTGVATPAAAPASSSSGATPAAPPAGANVSATSGASSGATPAAPLAGASVSATSGATPAAPLAGADVSVTSGASSGATPAAPLAGADVSVPSGATSGAAALPTGG